MNIDSIQNGVVLDHIQAGKSMDIYRYLHLDQLDCSVAIIKNVKSGKMGKKDIIKIDSPMEVDLDVLGYIDPNITVNIIRDGIRVDKKHLELPKKLVNIIHCKNPRCITVSEPQLDAIFLLSDPATHTYRCAYCETAKGVIGPLTGGDAIYGTAVANAAQIAVDEINALGGDVQFELITEDDTNDAETAVNAYNALMDQGMQILLGTVTTSPPWPWCPTPMTSGCSP